jgi:hypothetical protein
MEADKRMEKESSPETKFHHLPKTDRVITRNCARASGLGKVCHFCREPIEDFPYFSHLSGGSHSAHYYHVRCAKKIHIL